MIDVLPLGVAIAVLLVGIAPARSAPEPTASRPWELAQRGGQSDITGPNPIEFPITPATEAVTRLDRDRFERQLAGLDFNNAIQLLEEFQAHQFSDYLGIDFYGNAPNPTQIARELGEAWLASGYKPAFVYVSARADAIELFLVIPDELEGGAKESPDSNSNAEEGIFVRRKVSGIERQTALLQARDLHQKVANFNLFPDPNDYLDASREVYQWSIAPIENELEANEIDILIFSFDMGLRTLPIAVLHDGEQFLVERYALGIVPSFGLVDRGYRDVSQSEVLAMGASTFSDLPPLPAVPVELETIVDRPWQGTWLLDGDFTVANFLRQYQEQPYGVVHLATHGEFLPGNLDNSYIQFSDRRLTLSDFREIAIQLGWPQTLSTPVELLVLSACQTAVGDPSAELGFAGLAVQAGVKSALASLWYVSDLGTLVLMSEYYQQLQSVPVKAEALRRTQAAIATGQTRVEDGAIVLSNGRLVPLPPELLAESDLVLTHPFFWSAFTLIGNWN